MAQKDVLTDLSRVRNWHHGVDAGKTTNPPSASCTTPVSTTRLVRCMTARPPWTDGTGGASPSPAATTTFWKDKLAQYHRHASYVDFTVEVGAQSVLTAVAVFDGKEGVEQQPNRWRQPTNTMSPHLLLVNKMDKIGADFASRFAR